MAVLDVENLVEEASYMEAETVFLLFRKHLCILAVKDPTTL